MLELAATPIEVRIDAGQLDRVASCEAFRATFDHTPVNPYFVDLGDLRVSDQPVHDRPDLEEPLARAVILTRLWSLARGHSGVPVAVVNALSAMLATSFAPAIPQPSFGGAAIDVNLAAQAVKSLRGVGHAYLAGERLRADIALERAGLGPLPLSERDALAIVNTAALTTAAAGLAVARIGVSHAVAIMLTGVLSDVLGCDQSYLDPGLLQAFGHPQVSEVGQRIRAWSPGSALLSDPQEQTPDSLRYAPQLLGALGSSITYAADGVSRDLNGVTDDPMYFPEQDFVVQGGNECRPPSALASDVLSDVAIRLGTLAEGQIRVLAGIGCTGISNRIHDLRLGTEAIVAALRGSAPAEHRPSSPAETDTAKAVLASPSAGYPFADYTALDRIRWLPMVHGAIAIVVSEIVRVGVRRPTSPHSAAMIDKISRAMRSGEQDWSLGNVFRAARTLEQIVREDEAWTSVL
jgi:histidine ammonia-lyase/tyrosine ammonia-lyase